MGERPLPDEVARAARAYLAALVSPSARADAWHDLLAEVRYWQDDQLVPVLCLAHQVVGQHERVTDEAAAAALVEVGVADADDLAAVLRIDPGTARDLRERVDRAQESIGRASAPAAASPSAVRYVPSDDTEPVDAGAASAFAAAASTSVLEPPGEDDPVDPATAGGPPTIAPTTSASSPSASSPALRIGFDDPDDAVVATPGDDSDDSDDWDDSEDWDDEPSGAFLTYRRLVWIAVIVWLVVVAAWVLADG